MALTMFEKIWNSHVILEKPDGDALLHIDRNLVHEGSFHAFGALAKEGRKVRKPSQNFAVADHYVPTVGRERGVDGAEDADARHMIRLLEENSRVNGIAHYGIDDDRQGIVHVIGPELGITQPGLTITCGDSHTSTHGALGAYAFGTGASQLKQILATQCLWLKRPKTLRIVVNGQLAPGITGKDVVLAIIAKIGTAGATGHVIEFSGSAIRGLTVEGRLTVCNMAIEAGGRAGMIAPDDKVYEYLHGREFAPKGADWDRALTQWRALPSDDGARFDREVTLDGGKLEPMLTWGTSPEEALPVSGRIPDPKSLGDANQRAHAEQALAYMDLKPGMALTDIKIDRAFIGSCTNGRIEDLRAAAAVAKGRKVSAGVNAIVVPGSGLVKEQAEEEGLDKVFLEAGFEWRDPGCSMCLAMNADKLKEGERCASTSNRNFEGRQGRGGRTHLVSPAMAAAAAVTGHLTDWRTL